MELISEMQGYFNILRPINIIHFKRLRKKNHMIIPNDAQKIFDKIQRSVMVYFKKPSEK